MDRCVCLVPDTSRPKWNLCEKFWELGQLWFKLSRFDRRSRFLVVLCPTNVQNLIKTLITFYFFVTFILTFFKNYAAFFKNMFLIYHKKIVREKPLYISFFFEKFKDLIYFLEKNPQFYSYTSLSHRTEIIILLLPTIWASVWEILP